MPKRYLAALLVGLLVGGAGCVWRSSPETQGGIEVRIFLLLISTKQVEYYQWAEQAYEARHPEVDIVFEQFPGVSLKDYEIKIRLRYASRQSPDIWYFRENAMSEFVNLGLLDPAPDYIERIVQANSLNDMVRSAPYFNGICYGFAHNAAWTALYYNKQMFREAGLDPERPPRTWEEMLDYAEQLTQRRPDGSVSRAGLSLRKTGYKPGIAEKWLTFFYSAGGVPFNEEGTESYFDSEAGRRATELYRQVLFERRLDAVELEGDQQGFGQGRVAMFLRELHVVDWLKLNYPDIDFGVARIPSQDTTFSSGGAYPFVVSSDSKNKEAAWRFLEFLAGDEAYTKYMRMVRELPMLQSVADQPEFRDNPYLQVFRSQPVYTPPKFAHDKRTMDILGAYIERFSYGHLTADEMLRRLTEDVNAYLQANYARHHRATRR